MTPTDRALGRPALPARPRSWLIGLVAAAALLSAAPGVSAQQAADDNLQAEIDRLLAGDDPPEESATETTNEWSREQICELRAIPLGEYLDTLKDRSQGLTKEVGEWDEDVRDVIDQAETDECGEALERIEGAEQEGTRLRNEVGRLTTQLTHVRDCAREDYRVLLDQWLALTADPEEAETPAEGDAVATSDEPADGQAAPEADRQTGNVATDLFLYDAAVMFRYIGFDANLLISELTQDVDTRLGTLLQSMDDVRRRCEFLGG
ncbi:MAG: hypothetical protein GVY28_11155 [Alphaproteobacteria bacterium]|jgi:hypothetical protein|nr:hypothetical protein [Alphaproteobacteria bacterium]